MIPCLLGFVTDGFISGTEYRMADMVNRKWAAVNHGEGDGLNLVHLFEVMTGGQGPRSEEDLRGRSETRAVATT